MMKLLIKNALILTVNQNNEVLKNANIAVEDGRLLAVGKVPENFLPDKVIDASDQIALPGLCLLYTSPSPRDGLLSRMPSSA